MFTDLCHDLVGPDVRLYHDQAVYKKPEKPRRFPWHQDNGYTFVEPQQYLTCWVALTDATLDNGCPHIVPGLHRLGTLRHHFIDPLGWEIFEDHPDAIAAPVAEGGVVVFSSLTPHLTGPNTTDGSARRTSSSTRPTARRSSAATRRCRSQNRNGRTIRSASSRCSSAANPSRHHHADEPRGTAGQRADMCATS